MRLQATRRWPKLPRIAHSTSCYLNPGNFRRSFATECFFKDVDPLVAPHVRTCRQSLARGLDEENTNRRKWDTQFHAYFLGTGSGSSSRRMPSCTVLRLGSEGLVFDAGENAQHQIRSSLIRLKKVSKIFITHLHADHVMGLTGILLSTNIATLVQKDATLQVYGPPGLYNYIITALGLTHSKIRTTIEVFELVGGQCRVNWRTKGMMGQLPQFQLPNVIQKTIRCDSDGVWRIKGLTPVTKDSNSRLGMDFQITAAELYHVPNVQTFGYVVEEREPPERIDPTRAQELGLAPSKKYEQLKNRFPVMADDGTREIQPEEVLLPSPFKSRKVVILGDNCGIPPPMARLCRNADVLVHEATLREDQRALSVRRGHATPSMAGQFADNVKADLLVLNHVGDSYDHGQEVARVAEMAIKGGTRALGGVDFMEVAIPREGFKYHEGTDSSSSERTMTTREGRPDDMQPKSKWTEALFGVENSREKETEKAPPTPRKRGRPPLSKEVRKW